MTREFEARLFDDIDDDIDEAPVRRVTGGTTRGCATRVEIESGLGWVGVDHTGELAVDLDERVLARTAADRLGDYLVDALNRAFDAARNRTRS